MKHIMTILIMLLASTCYLFGFNEFEKATAEKNAQVVQPDNGQMLQSVEPRTVDVYLKKVYLDGQVLVNVKPVKIESMEDFWSKFSGWTLVNEGKDKIVFEKKINDISPILKTDGYFGLSEKHILTIYKGKPDQDKAIHSFFQIDVKELESTLQHKLQEGIPIESKHHYEKVIKHLKKYAAKKEQ